MKRSGRIARKSLRSISKQGVTHRKLHSLLREVVLARDGEKCRRCGAGKEKVLQAAHIYGKGTHGSMRYLVDNVLVLCKPCHYWWHSKGFGREAALRNEVREWCVAELGVAHMTGLDIISSYKPRKRKVFDAKLVEYRLRSELAKLRKSA